MGNRATALDDPLWVRFRLHPRAQTCPTPDIFFR